MLDDDEVNENKLILEYRKIYIISFYYILYVLYISYNKQFAQFVQYVLEIIQSRLLLIRLSTFELYHLLILQFL